MRLPSQALQKRDDNGAADATKQGMLALAICAIIVVLVIVLCFFVARYLRAKNYEPNLLPGSRLKKLWRGWAPGRQYGRVPGESNGTGQQLSHMSVNRNTDTSYAGAGPSAAGVDRNTSVRSVMTLPSYSANPTDTEEVIGREGERAGMDTVVEFPETADEEEDRREDQMEALYQIRLARRQEQDERAEARRERREARDRGDTARLQELRREGRERAQSRSNNLSVSALLTEHQSRARDRRVSSVSYAEVGHVRHDGTRLRANSQESDSSPLLDGAAGMADDGRSSLSRHDRAASGSSLASFSTAGSPQGGRGSPAHSESDIGDSSVNPPPQYDHLEWGEAPPYRPSTDDEDNNNNNSNNNDNDNSNSNSDSNSNDNSNSNGNDNGNNDRNNDRNNDSHAGPSTAVANENDTPSITTTAATNDNPTRRDNAPKLPPISTIPSIAIETATPPPSTPITPVSPAHPNTDRSR